MAMLAPDPRTSACPSRQLLDRIGDKWTVLVIGTLAGGPRRYSEIASEIEGISQKMLTQTLRHLERDGLVTRTVTASVPVRVDYELTGLGQDLTGPLRVLEGWATARIGEIEAAREVFDARGQEVAG